MSQGQVVGKPPEGALGVILHASLTGTVTAVNDSFITISKQ
ncbi:hypothetical protein CG709_20865 [Lachnotalea glycerini]|nr:hypothetical protein CG709_20865 [Lachnotalea glycerini]